MRYRSDALTPKSPKAPKAYTLSPCGYVWRPVYRRGVALRCVLVRLLLDAFRCVSLQDPPLKSPLYRNVFGEGDVRRGRGAPTTQPRSLPARRRPPKAPRPPFWGWSR